MSQPFDLLGVSGLLLPGTVERPCPGFNHADSMDDDLQKFMKHLVVNEAFRILAEKAATAACWWRWQNNTPLLIKENYTAGRQMKLWQRVFELACERMTK